MATAMDMVTGTDIVTATNRATNSNEKEKPTRASLFLIFGQI